MTSGDDTRALSTDVRGRVLMPAERRRQILAAFEKSGMSGVAFAAHIGVKYPTFAGWLRRSRLKGASSRPRRRPRSPVLFLEAKLPTPVALEVELPGGVFLRLRDPAQAALAAELLRLLHPC